jgi:hypothetical protein
MSAKCGWLCPNQQFPTKPYSCQQLSGQKRCFFRKAASDNEKGKENIEHLLALSDKAAEFAITICC